MEDEPKLRRAFLRGYRRGDVELALARATIARERLQVELDATRPRIRELEDQVANLHAQVDGHRRREQELVAALDEVRSRRETLEREARARADEVLGEAVQRAAELRTEGLRQVGELQQQVEQLLALRGGLTEALQRVLGDIGTALERLAGAPARGVERISGQGEERRREDATPQAPEPERSGEPVQDLRESLRAFSADAER